MILFEFKGLCNYWLWFFQVDADLDKMFVSELNGTNLKTLIQGCLDANNTFCFKQPRAVTVTPKYG